RITCRKKLEVAVATKDGDGIQGARVGTARPKCERAVELVAARIGTSLPGEEAVRVLPRGPQILGELGDGQPLGPEQGLPDIGILRHGDECNRPSAKAAARPRALRPLRGSSPAMPGARASAADPRP